MATSGVDILPVCDVGVLKTKRVLLVQNVAFMKVMPCISPFLTSSDSLTVNEQITDTDKIRKIIDVIDRLAKGSQYMAFNAFINALAGTQPELFTQVVGREPTVNETDFCVQNIVQQMKDNIKEMGHRTDSELDERIDFSYEHVELSIVDRKSDTESEHEVPHQYSDHLSKLEGAANTISAYDILSTTSKPNEKVLVFGRAGVGKSTTTQWLARQWAQGKWATGVTLLFLLQVRFLTNVDVPITVLDLLSLYSLYQLEDMADSLVLSSWLKNPASRILIFADGLDEIPGFASRMINTHRISDLTHKAHPIDLVVNILRGDLLPHSVVISASRPFLGLSSLHVDSKAEVLGLTSRKVTEYVVRRHPGKANQILPVLHKSPILLSVCGITYYCMLISRLLGDGVVLIDEEVQTYTRLMAFILVQYTSRRLTGSDFSLETSPFIAKLASMAHSGIFHTQENTNLAKIVFDNKNLINSRLTVDDLNYLKKTGIIQIREHQIGGRKSIATEFFHLSGQEMLAVLHFLCNSNNSDNVLHQLFSGGHFDMALMYTFGLHFDRTSKWVDELWTAMGSSGPGVDKSITSQLSLFIDTLSIKPRRKMKACQLVYEGQWVDKAKEVFSHIAPNGELRIEYITMTAIDLLAVDFVCRCGGSLRSVTFYNVNVDATFVKVMMSSLVKHNLGTLQVLNLTGNNIGADVAKTLTNCLSDTARQNTSLHTLDLSFNSIGSSGAKAVAAMLATNTSLRTLHVSHNSIDAAGAKAIASMLETNTSLHTINMYNNNMGDEGAEAIGAMLGTNTSLHRLDIQSNGIGAAGAKAITEGLSKNTSLTWLGIRYNENMGPAEVEALTDISKHRPTLTIHI